MRGNDESVCNYAAITASINKSKSLIPLALVQCFGFVGLFRLVWDLGLKLILHRVQSNFHKIPAGFNVERKVNKK